MRHIIAVTSHHHHHTVLVHGATLIRGVSGGIGIMIMIHIHHVLMVLMVHLQHIQVHLNPI
jgi:hypothetical protein